MSSWERVDRAIRFERPDRTPRDFAAAPEVWARLAGHFGTPDRGEILRRLGVDCRIVSYDSFVDVKAFRAAEPDGSKRDIWGAHRRTVTNAFGTLDELVSYPLAAARSLDDLRVYRWPEPDWWDFRGLRAVISGLNETARYSIRYRVGSVFETAWSLYGLERFLLDLASAPEMPAYILRRIAEVHIENLRRVLETAGDLIDIVYFYDDLASQQGLLLSPASYARHIEGFHSGMVECARQFGKPAMLHSCGSVFRLITRFLDMGLAILNPVQPGAKNMAPERLAGEFGGRIVFHGGVDVQHLLPRATPDEVRAEVRRISEILGHNGGYIRAGSHHLQADTPLENVLAMYAVE